MILRFKGPKRQEKLPKHVLGKVPCNFLLRRTRGNRAPTRGRTRELKAASEHRPRRTLKTASCSGGTAVAKLGKPDMSCGAAVGCVFFWSPARVSQLMPAGLSLMKRWLEWIVQRPPYLRHHQADAGEGQNPQSLIQGGQAEVERHELQSQLLQNAAHRFANLARLPCSGQCRLASWRSSDRLQAEVGRAPRQWNGFLCQWPGCGRWNHGEGFASNCTQRCSSAGRPATGSNLCPGCCEAGTGKEFLGSGSARRRHEPTKFLHSLAGLADSWLRSWAGVVAIHGKSACHGRCNFFSSLLGFWMSQKHDASGLHRRRFWCCDAIGPRRDCDLLVRAGSSRWTDGWCSEDLWPSLWETPCTCSEPFLSCPRHQWNCPTKTIPLQLPMRIRRSTMPSAWRFVKRMRFRTQSMINQRRESPKARVRLRAGHVWL